MDAVVALVSAASDFVWGPFFLIPLLLLTGLYLTLVLRGLQFRTLLPALHLAFVVRKDETSEGDISHFQALMTALSATVGTGNIVGVATAIAAGGPGALFWMWMTGLVGMATKYSEALLSVKYRVRDSRGEQQGGPMYYLSRGIPNVVVGRALGLAFALFGTLAAFGIGNMTQTNSVAEAMENAFGLPKWLTGLVVAAGVGAVILGGIKRIGKFTGVFVPVMVVVYMVACAVILVLKADQIPGALALIFGSAFTGTAAVGGFLGAGVSQAVRFGVARGIFSNESGLGSAGMAAAAAQTREPVRQALVSMTQTFLDTLVVCTMTGLAILCTDSWQQGLAGAEVTQRAFREALGAVGEPVVAICLAMFATSTVLGWSYYGERCLGYLAGEKPLFMYRVVFVVVAFFGSIFSLKLVWLVSDVMNGLMAVPNLIGLLWLSGVIRRETQAYLERG